MYRRCPIIRRRIIRADFHLPEVIFWELNFQPPTSQFDLF